MELLLLPLMGPWHLRYPRYNAVTLRDLLADNGVDALAATPLEPGFAAQPGWQDTPELALPLALVPWARAQGLPIYGLLERSPDEEAAADWGRYAAEYPQLGAAQRAVEAELGGLAPLLNETLDLERILREVLPLLRQHQEARETAFGDGPASDWLRARARVMAERLLALPHERLALLASAEHAPFVQDALGERVRWLAPRPLEPSPASRERSLLDYALRGDAPEPERLLAQLRELSGAEARYHEANLLLAHDHPAKALAVLEAASAGDFSAPYFLPGYLLARLGQLYDLAGRRARAEAAYRGALALSYAPEAALEAARAGLAEPFRWGPPSP